MCQSGGALSSTYPISSHTPAVFANYIPYFIIRGVTVVSCTIETDDVKTNSFSERLCWNVIVFGQNFSTNACHNVVLPGKTFSKI